MYIMLNHIKPLLLLVASKMRVDHDKSAETEERVDAHDGVTDEHGRHFAGLRQHGYRVTQRYEPVYQRHMVHHYPQCGYNADASQTR